MERCSNYEKQFLKNEKSGVQRLRCAIKQKHNYTG